MATGPRAKTATKVYMAFATNNVTLQAGPAVIHFLADGNRSNGRPRWPLLALVTLNPLWSRRSLFALSTLYPLWSRRPLFTLVARYTLWSRWPFGTHRT